MADNRNTWLPLDEADLLLNGLLPPTRGETLLHLLISEGLLARDIHWPKSRDEYIEIVRFPYERFADHMIVKRLLDRFLPRWALKFWQMDTIGGPATVFSKMGRVARSLLRSLASRAIRRAFRRRSPLGQIITDEQTCWINQSLLDALSVQLPERTNRELVDVAPFCEGFVPTQQALLRSLLWRDSNAFTISTDKLIKEHALRFDDTSRQLLDILLTLSAIPDHPYNARYLHTLLFTSPLPDRDAWWSTWLHYQLGEHGAVDRLLDWARSSKLSSGVDDDTTELMSISMAWFLSCPDREVRDNATKGLVALLERRPKILKRVLETFAGVDDPYVTERLYAVAYGCSMRQSEGLAELAEYIYRIEFQHGVPIPNILARDYARGVLGKALSLNLPIACEEGKIRPPYASSWPADIPSKESLEKYREPGANSHDVGWSQVHLYDSVVGSGDFARYIIGTNSNVPHWWARRLGDPQPPSITQVYEQFCKSLDARETEQFLFYKSAVEKLKTLRRGLQLLQLMREAPDDTIGSKAGAVSELEESFAPELQTADNEASSAHQSVIMLLNRPQKDVFIKQIAPFVEDPDAYTEEPRFDLSIAQRWIFARVLDLGWSVQRFGSFDRAMGTGRYQRNPGAERVGKKYQWIAYYEFLARLADNFEFAERWNTERAKYNGPWQLDLRNIDPSFLDRRTYADGFHTSTATWWSPTSYEFPANLAGHDWIEAEEDLPAVEPLLLVQPEDSTKWLSLQTHVEWQEPYEPGEDYLTRSSKRHMYYLIFSYIVHKRDKSAFVEWAREQHFFGRWMPEGPDIHQVFQGECFWAPAAGSCNVDWTSDAHSPDGTRIPVELRPTAANYYGTFEYDASIDERISMYVPADWLCKQMNLSWAPHGRFLSGDSLIAFDPSTYKNGPSALLVSFEAFRKFLDEKEMDVVWTVLGEKLIVERGGGSAERLLVSGVYELSATGQVTGKLKTRSKN